MEIFENAVGHKSLFDGLRFRYTTYQKQRSTSNRGQETPTKPGMSGQKACCEVDVIS